MKREVLTVAVLMSLSPVFAASLRCKAPTHCEFEALKMGYCEEHTCHTEGCNEPVKFALLPAWAKYKPPKTRGWGQQNNQQQEKKGPQYLVYKFCKKHYCQYLKPREKSVQNKNNPGGFAQDPNQQYVDMDGAALVEALGCPGERLYKSAKYCINHVCAAPRCDKEPLVSQRYCRDHISYAKKENPPKREGVQAETWSDFNKRRAEEKAKAKEEAAAKEAARKEEWAKKKAEREAASSSASSDDAASTADSDKSSASDAGTSSADQ